MLVFFETSMEPLDTLVILYSAVRFCLKQFVEANFSLSDNLRNELDDLAVAVLDEVFH